MSDTPTTSKKQPPVHKVRVGYVSASIWARSTEKGTYYTATLQRSYRDGKGKWHSTDFIDGDELQNARKALDIAHDHILKLAANARRQAAEAGEGA